MVDAEDVEVVNGEDVVPKIVGLGDEEEEEEGDDSEVETPMEEVEAEKSHAAKGMDDAKLKIKGALKPVEVAAEDTPDEDSPVSGLEYILGSGTNVIGDSSGEGDR